MDAKPHDDARPGPGILVLSAPSGAGKTSLARALAAAHPGAGVTISHTTRERRPRETHGEDYYFVSRAEFETMIAEGRFIEYATVFDHWYGTSTDAIETLISGGRHAILDIDWQGARIVRERYPRAVSVFILPPSLAALEQRLTDRGRDDPGVIARRMQQAADEIAHQDEFDVVITNDDFDRALAELSRVLHRLAPANEPKP